MGIRRWSSTPIALPEEFAIAEHLGREWVIKIEGKVRARQEGAENPDMATGQIEVLANRPSGAQ